MFITTNDVVDRTGISKVTLWRYRQQFTDFPKPIVLGPTTIRWVAEEIDAWFFGRRSLGQEG